MASSRQRLERASAEMLTMDQMAEALVVAARKVAKDHWPWLRGDGWPAYDEDGSPHQVLRVNEFAQAILGQLSAEKGEKE